MIAYPDTSFLVALYRRQSNSREAVAHAIAMSEPLHISSLVLFEFRQSLRLQEFLHEKNSNLGFDRATGHAALSKLQANLAAGGLIMVAANWNDVLQLADQLSSRHTARGGYRGFDILHVATALHLGAAEFLTFDDKQKKLAKAEGLKTPF